MSEPRFTTEQLAAIHARGQDILLSAAAGSGKTSVLIERIASLLLEGMDISRMLVLTFTRAAASEMKQRLTARLSIAARDESLSDTGRAHAREQLFKLPGANVSTIHSFCQDIIRRNISAAQADPGFRILDESEQAELFEATLSDMLEDMYEQSSASFLFARACFEPRFGDMGLRGAISGAYRFIRSMPHPERWFPMAIDSLERGTSRLNRLEYCRSRLSAARDALVQALALCDENKDFEKHRAALEPTHIRLGELAALEPESLPEALKSPPPFPRFPSTRGLNTDVKQRITTLRDKAKNILKQLEPLLSDVDDQIMLPVLWELARLVSELDARYARRKETALALDYQDLEHKALLALEAGAAEDIRSSLDAVLVDEYQDVSRSQEAVLSMVSPEGKRFDVGDIKQSIYRFRLAAPELFLGKLSAYSKDESSTQRLLTLSRNFRSCGAIIDLVNLCFSKLMDCERAEIDYSSGHALVLGIEDSQDSGAAEYIMLEDGEGEDEFVAFTRDLMQARYAAMRVRDMLGTPFYDVKRKLHRPLEAADIALISRVTRPLSLLAEQFKALNVPVAAGQSEPYSFEFDAARALISLVLNPLNDTALLTALLTPRAGFTYGELAEIRRVCPDGPFHLAARATANGNSGLAKKLSDFYNTLELWRAASRSLPVNEFVELLFGSSGLSDEFSLGPSGEKRRATLDAILDEAQRFSARGGALPAFLKLLDAKAYYPAHSAETPAGDGVRLLTMHKSKGLEFPVVFILGMEGKRMFREQGAAMLLDRELGIGIKNIDPICRTISDSPQRSYIAQIQKRAFIAEELRLLYVGMTRAQNRLIMLGSYKSAADTLTSLAKREPSAALLEGEAIYGAWLLPLLMRLPAAASVRALIGEPPSDEHSADIPVSFEIIDTSKLAEPHYKRQTENLSKPETAVDLSWIEERLYYEYPFPEAAITSAKLSVSEFARIWVDENEAPLPPEEAPRPYKVRSPKFFSDSGASGSSSRDPAARGSAYHILLRALDYSSSSMLELRAQLDGLVNSGHLTPEESDLIDLSDIMRFLNTPLAHRMASAQLTRETPFTLTRPAAGGEQLIQGVVDAYFIENNQIVLVDFKTDHFPPGGAHAAAAKHFPQLAIYRAALETLLGIPVGEALIVMLSSGDVVPLQ